jgi:hypothetical protein
MKNVIDQKNIKPFVLKVRGDGAEFALDRSQPTSARRFSEHGIDRRA